MLLKCVFDQSDSCSLSAIFDILFVILRAEQMVHNHCECSLEGLTLVQGHGREAFLGLVSVVECLHVDKPTGISSVAAGACSVSLLKVSASKSSAVTANSATEQTSFVTCSVHC